MPEVSTVTIAQERPDTPDAMALIAELEDDLATADYPPESRHGLSVAALIEQGVDFFVLRRGGQPAGCGGLLCVGRDYAEVKRMYVRPAYRGQGLARRIIGHLEAHARRRGVGVLRLETGIKQVAARRLYESSGFRSIPPFGPYRPDPIALFYEKHIPVSSAGHSRAASDAPPHR